MGTGTVPTDNIADLVPATWVLVPIDPCNSLSDPCDVELPLATRVLALDQ